jgi:hypothetical protein
MNICIIHIGEAPTSNVGKLMVLPIERHEEKTRLLAEAFGKNLYIISTNICICMYVYMCICICIYLHTYMFIHLHTSLCIHIYIYICI